MLQLTQLLTLFRSLTDVLLLLLALVVLVVAVAVGGSCDGDENVAVAFEVNLSQ